jgi:hypothetical protein
MNYNSCRDGNLVKEFAIRNSERLVEISIRQIQQEEYARKQYEEQSVCSQNEYHFFKCKALAYNLEKLKLRYETLKASMEKPN